MNILVYRFRMLCSTFWYAYNYLCYAYPGIQIEVLFWYTDIEYSVVYSGIHI